MSSQKIEKNLQDLGFQEKEIGVYLAVLELGEGTARDIAEKSQTERVNTYYILGQLEAKGLVSETVRSGKKVFIAANPDHLVNLAQLRLESIKEILPELKSLYNAVGYKPKIQFFEGKEGLAAILDDILATSRVLPEAKREILEYTSPDSAALIMKKEQLKFVKDRIKNKIRLRWLTSDTPYARKLYQERKETYREMRLVEPTEFSLTTEVDIYGDKMALFGSKETPLGVIVEHKEMVQTQRQIFELAWQGAKAK